MRSGKSKCGLANGGLRPLSTVCAQLSTIVHMCGLSGPFSKGNSRRQMTTIVGEEFPCLGVFSVFSKDFLGSAGTENPW